MKKNKLQVIILTILICTIVSSAFAQTNLRSIIQGEKGRSANDSRVSVDQKISFIPSKAKAIFGLDNNADLVLKNTEPDQSGYVQYTCCFQQGRHSMFEKTGNEHSQTGRAQYFLKPDRHYYPTRKLL